MLFPRLEGEHEAALAVSIDGLADYTSRQLPDIVLAAGHEAYISSAEGYRDAE